MRCALVYAQLLEKRAQTVLGWIVVPREYRFLRRYVFLFPPPCSSSHTHTLHLVCSHHPPPALPHHAATAAAGGTHHQGHRRLPCQPPLPCMVRQHDGAMCACPYRPVPSTSCSRGCVALTCVCAWMFFIGRCNTKLKPSTTSFFSPLPLISLSLLLSVPCILPPPLSHLQPPGTL